MGIKKTKKANSLAFLKKQNSLIHCFFILRKLNALGLWEDRVLFFFLQGSFLAILKPLDRVGVLLNHLPFLKWNFFPKIIVIYLRYSKSRVVNKIGAVLESTGKITL